MTNSEWLKSLEPGELSAWFESEHADELHDVAHESESVTRTVGMSLEKLQRENMALARDLGNCMADRDGLQAAYDGIVAIAADLCRACGFSMVDACGEVIS